MYCEWIQAEGSDNDHRLLYLHGGSWMAGGVAEYRPLLSRISAATGCVVLGVDYRLAPEHPFPAGLEDCRRAFDWIRAYGPTGEGPARRRFVAGDSAGGNLALALLQSLKQDGETLPDAVAAISPATDFLVTGKSAQSKIDVDPVIRATNLPAIAKYYCPGQALDHPLISPLYGNLAGLPPTLVQVGEWETLLDDSVQYAERAKRQGSDVRLSVWNGMPHVWHVFAPELAEAVRAIDELGAFFRSFVR